MNDIHSPTESPLLDKLILDDKSYIRKLTLAFQNYNDMELLHFFFDIHFLNFFYK